MTTALLAGCSALRLGYSQAPTLAYWWTDRYFDFDAAQSTQVRAALDDWFRWHRQTQLADAADLLARAADQALEPATGAQVCRWADDITQRLNLAYERAVPAMADIALTLKPAQLKTLAQRYERGNEDFAKDFMQPSPEARLKASVQRAVERAEYFYGRLDTRQRALVARGVQASPFDAELWLAERRARQKDVLDSLTRWTTERASPEVVRAGLRSLAQRTQRSPREAYRDYQKRLLDYNCAFAADIHNATTAAQRRRAAERMDGWAGDLRSLMAMPAAEPGLQP